MITITIQTSDFNFLVLKSNDNDTCFTLSPSLPRLDHKWSDLRRQGRPLSYLSNKWRNGKVRNGKKKKLHILLDTFLTDTVERVGNITVDISPPVIVRGQIRFTMRKRWYFSKDQPSIVGIINSSRHRDTAITGGGDWKKKIFLWNMRECLLLGIHLVKVGIFLSLLTLCHS